eukprot:3753146-Rhodomonas_salina.3
MFGFKQLSKLTLRVQTRAFSAVPSTMKAAVIRETGGPKVLPHPLLPQSSLRSSASVLNGIGDETSRTDAICLPLSFSR